MNNNLSQLSNTFFFFYKKKGEKGLLLSGKLRVSRAQINAIALMCGGSLKRDILIENSHQIYLNFQRLKGINDRVSHKLLV